MKMCLLVMVFTIKETINPLQIPHMCKSHSMRVLVFDNTTRGLSDQGVIKIAESTITVRCWLLINSPLCVYSPVVKLWSVLII